MTRDLFVPSAILAIVVVGVGSYYAGRTAKIKADRAAKPEVVRNRIFALGRIEPKNGIINVSSIPGEQLKSLTIPKKNITKGTPLGELVGHKLAAANYEKSQDDYEALNSLSDEAIRRVRLDQQNLVVLQAEQQYERTRIVAPTDGVILRTFIQPGETIGREPVFQMADLSQMVVIAEVYEAEVKHVKVDQKVKIESRALDLPKGKMLLGTVREIGSIIGTPAIRSMNPLAASDRHVLEVRIELDDKTPIRDKKTSADIAASMINLEVDVHFQITDDSKKLAKD